MVLHIAPQPATVGLRPPLEPGLDSALRLAVLGHVSAERRRVFAPVLHLGEPGGRHLVLAPDGALDHALRIDLVEALARRHRRATVTGAAQPSLVWLTRSGSLETRDDDVAWSSAVRSAGQELALDLPMVVVTRCGWRDPASGAERTWRRLRPARR